METQRFLNSLLFVITSAILMIGAFLVSLFSPWREPPFNVSQQSVVGSQRVSTLLYSEVLPFVASIQMRGVVVLVIIAISVLVLAPRLARKSAAVAFVVRPCPSIIGLILLSFFFGELLLLALSLKAQDGFEIWDIWFLITTLLFCATLYLNQKAALIFGEGTKGIAPFYALLIVALTFAITFAGRQFSYSGRGDYSSKHYWIILGTEITGSLYMALSFETMVLFGVIGLHISSESMLQGWYTLLIFRKLSIRAYDECVSACDAGVTICSRSPKFLAVFLNIKGVSLSKRGDHQAAVDAFTEAIRLVPNSRLKVWRTDINWGNVYSNRADALFQLGRYQEAWADCEEALKIDPFDNIAKALRDELKSKGAAT